MPTGPVREDANQAELACVILLSLPPQCDGVPLANWDWDAVDGAQSGSGTTLGEFHVVGTYADGVLTVTDVGPAELDDLGAGSGTVRSYTTSCAEPAGGWPTAEIGVAHEEAFAAGSAIARHGGHVALWVLRRRSHAGRSTARSRAAGRQDHELVVTGDVAERGGIPRLARPACGPARGARRPSSRHPAEAERSSRRSAASNVWSQGGDVGWAEVGVVIDVDGAGQRAGASAMAGMASSSGIRLSSSGFTGRKRCATDVNSEIRTGVLWAALGPGSGPGPSTQLEEGEGGSRQSRWLRVEQRYNG